MGFELKTLVVIGTDCTGSYKSTYHTITIKRSLKINNSVLARRHAVIPTCLFYYGCYTNINLSKCILLMKFHFTITLWSSTICNHCYKNGSIKWWSSTICNLCYKNGSIKCCRSDRSVMSCRFLDLCFIVKGLFVYD